MNRFLVLSIASATLCAELPPVLARSHHSRSDTTEKSANPSSAADGAPSAPSTPQPIGSTPPLAAAAGTGTTAGTGTAAGAGTAAGTAAGAPPTLGTPAAPPQYTLPPPQYALPPPQYALPPPSNAPPVALPATRTRKYWELSAYGGVALGGVYLASVLAGSISYGGFYKGQWGFFVPLVGPALTLGNVGDQVCPCYASQLYAYTIGSVLSIATIGALVPIILGGILTKTVPVQSSKLQLVPTVARDANGFQLVGRF